MKFKFDGVVDMIIREVNENKKQFISLLLLADEQENKYDPNLKTIVEESQITLTPLLHMVLW